jgi:hypothetical protein
MVIREPCDPARGVSGCAIERFLKKNERIACHMGDTNHPQNAGKTGAPRGFFEGRERPSLY